MLQLNCLVAFNNNIGFPKMSWHLFSLMDAFTDSVDFREVGSQVSWAYTLAFSWEYCCLITLRPTQNGRHFPNNIFKWIFLNENVWISIKISLKFIPDGPFDNIPALVQIMTWHWPGDKPSPEPMLVTQTQWVNKMAATSQTKFSNFFSWKKIVVIWQKFQ